MLRIACLYRTGELGSRLFSYPLVGGSQSMYINGTSVKALMWQAPVWMYGTSPWMKKHRLKYRLSKEYELCALLLDKKLDEFVRKLVKYHELTKLPTHYKEAILLYCHLRTHPIVEFHDNVMDADFSDYQSMERKYSNPVERQSVLRDDTATHIGTIMIMEINNRLRHKISGYRSKWGYPFSASWRVSIVDAPSCAICGLCPEEGNTIGEGSVKSGKNLPQAQASMQKLLADSANQNNKKIWNLYFDAVRKQYEQGNEKLYLKQKYDTAQLFNFTRQLFEIAQQFDSVEMVPNKKGKVEIEFRKQHADYLSHIRTNLFNGGLWFLGRKYADSISSSTVI